MTSKKKIINLRELLLLVLFGLPLTLSMDINCNGKAFHCINSTHFMICVDLGGGVTRTVDNFIIPCPATTVCQSKNYFECEFVPTTSPKPIISEVTNINEAISNVNSTTSLWEGIVTTTFSPLQNVSRVDPENNHIGTTESNSVSTLVVSNNRSDSVNTIPSVTVKEEPVSKKIEIITSNITINEIKTPTASIDNLTTDNAKYLLNINVQEDKTNATNSYKNITDPLNGIENNTIYEKLNNFETSTISLVKESINESFVNTVTKESVASTSESVISETSVVTESLSTVINLNTPIYNIELNSTNMSLINNDKLKLNNTDINVSNLTTYTTRDPSFFNETKTIKTSTEKSKDRKILEESNNVILNTSDTSSININGMINNSEILTTVPMLEPVVTETIDFLTVVSKNVTTTNDSIIGNQNLKVSDIILGSSVLEIATISIQPEILTPPSELGTQINTFASPRSDLKVTHNRTTDTKGNATFMNISYQEVNFSKSGKSDIFAEFETTTIIVPTETSLLPMSDGAPSSIIKNNMSQINMSIELNSKNISEKRKTDPYITTSVENSTNNYVIKIDNYTVKAMDIITKTAEGKTSEYINTNANKDYNKTVILEITPTLQPITTITIINDTNIKTSETTKVVETAKNVNNSLFNENISLNGTQVVELFTVSRNSATSTLEDLLLKELTQVENSTVSTFINKNMHSHPVEDVLKNTPTYDNEVSTKMYGSTIHSTESNLLKDLTEIGSVFSTAVSDGLFNKSTNIRNTNKTTAPIDSNVSSIQIEVLATTVKPNENISSIKSQNESTSITTENTLLYGSKNIEEPSLIATLLDNETVSINHNKKEFSNKIDTNTNVTTTLPIFDFSLKPTDDMLFNSSPQREENILTRSSDVFSSNSFQVYSTNYDENMTRTTISFYPSTSLLENFIINATSLGESTTIGILNNDMTTVNPITSYEDIISSDMKENVKITKPVFEFFVNTSENFILNGIRKPSTEIIPLEKQNILTFKSENLSSNAPTLVTQIPMRAIGVTVFNSSYSNLNNSDIIRGQKSITTMVPMENISNVNLSENLSTTDFMKIAAAVTTLQDFADTSLNLTLNYTTQIENTTITTAITRTTLIEESSTITIPAENILTSNSLDVLSKVSTIRAQVSSTTTEKTLFNSSFSNSENVELDSGLKHTQDSVSNITTIVPEENTYISNLPENLIISRSVDPADINTTVATLLDFSINPLNLKLNHTTQFEDVVISKMFEDSSTVNTTIKTTVSPLINIVINGTTNNKEFTSTTIPEENYSATLDLSSSTKDIMNSAATLKTLRDYSVNSSENMILNTTTLADFYVITPSPIEDISQSSNLFLNRSTGIIENLTSTITTTLQNSRVNEMIEIMSTDGPTKSTEFYTEFMHNISSKIPPNITETATTIFPITALLINVSHIKASTQTSASNVWDSTSEIITSGQSNITEHQEAAIKPKITIEKNVSNISSTTNLLNNSSLIEMTNSSVPLQIHKFTTVSYNGTTPINSLLDILTKKSQSLVNETKSSPNNRGLEQSGIEPRVEKVTVTSDMLLKNNVKTQEKAFTVKIPISVTTQNSFDSITQTAETDSVLSLMKIRSKISNVSTRDLSSTSFLVDGVTPLTNDDNIGSSTVDDNLEKKIIQSNIKEYTNPISIHATRSSRNYSTKKPLTYTTDNVNLEVIEISSPVLYSGNNGNTINSTSSINVPDNKKFIPNITHKEDHITDVVTPQIANLEENINANHKQAGENMYTHTKKALKENTNDNTNKHIRDNHDVDTSVPYFDCRHHNHGRYADKDDCMKFYICIGKQKPIIGACPVNTVFSEIKKQCTKNLSHCIRNNQFQCLSEGRFGDFFSENIYYICVKNTRLNTYVKFKFHCQKGYHLDHKTVKCVENIEESNQSTSSNGNDSNKDSEKTIERKSKDMYEYEHSESKENNFQCEEEGKFPDPNDCKTYYVCSKSRKGFRRKKKKCNSDEIFHKDKKKCVDSDSYEC